MTELAPKRISDSMTEQVQILMPEQLNGYKRLFGGKLMEWIDVLAAVVARRHCCKNVTTACIDSLEFKEPAFVNDTLVLKGRVTYVGRTSMEIKVDTFVESLDGSRRLINTAFFVMVALDDNNRPTAVPQLILETDEEKHGYEAGKRRAAERKQRIKQEEN